MDRNDIYDYCKLQANLWQTAMNWIRNIVKDTKYQSVPYQINNIALLDGGCISLHVTFLINGQEIAEDYRINVKELENV